MTATSLSQAIERLLRYAALIVPPWPIHSAGDLERLADGLRDRLSQPVGSHTPPRIRRAAQRYYGVEPETQRRAYAAARQEIPDDGALPADDSQREEA